MNKKQTDLFLYSSLGVVIMLVMVVLVNVRGTLGDPLPTDFLLRLALKLWLEVSSRGSSS